MLPRTAHVRQLPQQRLWHCCWRSGGERRQHQPFELLDHLAPVGSKYTDLNRPYDGNHATDAVERGRARTKKSVHVGVNKRWREVVERRDTRRHVDDEAATRAKGDRIAKELPFTIQMIE